MKRYEMMNSDLVTMHQGAMQKDFRRVALWTWIERHLQPGRVLDAGGGSGFMSVKALRAGYDTTLVEPDDELVQFAEKRIREMGLDASFQALHQPLEALTADSVSAMDNILCLDVLEHIDQPVSALQRLADLLRPDGTLIISVPALPFLYGKRDEAYGHYRRYTASMLREQVVQVPQLHIDRMQYWNLIGVPPYFVYEKIIQQPINDTLRQKEGNRLMSAVRSFLTTWLQMETHLPLPVGLSLLAVVRKRAGSQ